MADYESRFQRLLQSITERLNSGAVNYVEGIREKTIEGLKNAERPYTEEEFQEMFITMLEFHLQVLIDQENRGG